MGPGQLISKQRDLSVSFYFVFFLSFSALGISWDVLGVGNMPPTLM